MTDKTVEQAQTAEVQSEAVAQAPQEVRLTLEDLGALANVIKIAQGRGAFQVEEMSGVGAVYDKLNYFLSQAAEAAKAQAQAAATEEADSV